MPHSKNSAAREVNFWKMGTKERHALEAADKWPYHGISIVDYYGHGLVVYLNRKVKKNIGIKSVFFGFLIIGGLLLQWRRVNGYIIIKERYICIYIYYNIYRDIAYTSSSITGDAV